jgi:FtsZ-binding cell division protein ZapB
MLSNLIQVFELATIVLLFLCVLKQYNKLSGDEKAPEKPKKVIKQSKKMTKKEQKEQERLQAILDNIDNYSGDGLGQKEVK